MPDYGRRLLPNILHQRGISEPCRVFASIPKEDGQTFQTITYGQVSNATSYVAEWLRDKFPSTCQHEVIAYIGVPDLRYNFFYYAVLQSRLTVFVPSPRNTTSINASLLASTKCTKLIFSPELQPVAEALRAATLGLDVAELPSLNALLKSKAAPPTPLKFEDVCFDTALILQSSGSTGPPKPIIMTNMAAATCDVHDWPTVPGRINHDIATTFYAPGSNYMVDFFPPWHLAGYFSKIVCPLLTETIAVFGPPLRPPSGALMATIIRAHRPRIVFLPPSLTEQLVHEPGGLDLLKQLEVFFFGGGPLSDAVGDELSKYVQVCQFYGSTETGQIRQLLPSPADWAYMEFHPAEPFEMQAQGDGLYELVLLSKKQYESSQWLQSTYPHVKEWHTRDLFWPHPTKPSLWKFATRIDDILILSNGEKLNPLPMEMALTAHSDIRGALLVGQGQFRPGLLLEMDALKPRQLDSLWPSIQEANAEMPQFGRIAKSMVAFADPGRPFIRASKGTVVRRQTEKLYEGEIRDLYQDDSSTSPLSLKQAPSLLELTELVRASINQNGLLDAIGNTDNVYLSGLDSIGTIDAVKTLKKHLELYCPSQDLDWMTSELLYLNPTVKEVSAILLDYLCNGTVPKRRDRTKEMQLRIEQAIQNFPEIDMQLKVAITGTTGFLGGRLAFQVAKELKVAKVYCLNRSASAAANFGLRYGSIDPKLEFKECKLHEEMLGLSDEDYSDLKSCDVVIHNAWSVDFNRALTSFEDNIKSVENLVRLSAASHRRTHIVFVSSISAGGVWSAPGTPRHTVPAAVLDDLSETLDLGYAESKQVSEHILKTAYERRIPTSIVRIGQICPSTKHDDRPWPVDDFIAVYLRTCKSLGWIATDFIDRVDWVPLDAAATIVRDIALRNPIDLEMPVFNVVNPHPTAWFDLVPAITAWGGEAMQETNLEDWMHRLRNETGTDSEGLKRLPALRTMPIYELLTKAGPFHDYEMGNLDSLSPGVGSMPAITPDLLRSFLERL